MPADVLDPVVMWRKQGRSEALGELKSYAREKSEDRWEERAGCGSSSSGRKSKSPQWVSG